MLKHFLLPTCTNLLLSLWIIADPTLMCKTERIIQFSNILFMHHKCLRAPWDIKLIFLRHFLQAGFEALISGSVVGSAHSYWSWDEWFESSLEEWTEKKQFDISRCYQAFVMHKQKVRNIYYFFLFYTYFRIYLWDITYLSECYTIKTISSVK